MEKEDMKLEDIKLIDKAKRDPKQYSALYKRYCQKVYNYFWYNIGHNRETAEDLTQETFMRAFKDISNFRHLGYSYLTYLLKISHNLMVNYFRSNRDRVFLDVIPDIADPKQNTSSLDSKLRAEILWRRATQRLSPMAKSAMTMKYNKDMSIKDIALVLGKSENAVKLILSRSRKKLQEYPDIIKLGSLIKPPPHKEKPKFLEKTDLKLIKKRRSMSAASIK